MINIKDISYSCQKTETSILITDFQPKVESTLITLNKTYSEKKFFYLQTANDNLEFGKLYSHILYTERAEIFLKPHQIKSDLEITYGSTPLSSNQVKDLAIEHNEDETIFPASMLESFKRNTSLLDNDALSVQIYKNGELIGHISALKIKDDIFPSDNLFCLLRLIVHREHREPQGIKELLMFELKKYLPENASLTFQVFPKNHRALSFFSRRINAKQYYQKWIVE